MVKPLSPDMRTDSHIALIDEESLTAAIFTVIQYTPKPYNINIIVCNTPLACRIEVNVSKNILVENIMLKHDAATMYT